jgi:hypothetical protein
MRAALWFLAAIPLTGQGGDDGGSKCSALDHQGITARHLSVSGPVFET